MKKHIARALATGLYSGYFPVASGTFGSIPPFAIAYFFLRESQLALAFAAAVATTISIWAAGEAEEFLGHDSKKIVSDEWAGMFVTVLFIPPTAISYIVAFFSFRVLDVVKIWPAADAEKLPGGWGVTMDDIVAGIQANLVTRVMIFVIAYFQ